MLGFKNLSGKPDEAWISTALAEMLSTELAAGEQVRTIPGENIARMKVDLSLADADSFGQDSLTKIRNHLGTDLIVVGSYLAMGKAGAGQDPARFSPAGYGRGRDHRFRLRDRHRKRIA